MDPSAKFWDKIAERYSRRPVGDDAAYQKKLQITRDYLHPAMEVLEIGCGTGSTAITHAPYVKHIHAIDISSKMIEIAQAKADRAGINNVSFAQLSIDDFSVAEQSLDVVLGLSILHLLDNWQEVVAKVHTMLKPDGIFVTSTACIGDSMKFFKLVVPIGKFLGLIPSVKIFTTNELIGALTDAGFETAYQWQPGKNKSVFVVSKKAARRR